jgi:hypothetical protein
MNTPEDVIDAMQQYRTGKFGAIQTEQEVRDEQEENE